MKKINIALVRLIQFVVFVVFTFVVIVYFAAMVFIPLDALVMISKVLSVVGINTFVGALIGLPVVGYLGKIVYETPGLVAMVMETGIDLVKTGKDKVEAFNKIAEAVK
ncbi:MAG: hypothetical protein HOE45_11425 [Gammaproteobacteria bacterium]|jgi:hypothetical protein|uniref:hypothetical protein n=1 Tax=Methyloprofundus sp. TaxID=2020875 RepID=UPI0017BE64E2|nr:hypothetical protein [Methyloprofundus sp.]MBT3812316.1 hypothetical protein [Gammaproteobacteria bacterium]HIL78090.1 hypothetical protein [Methylococcales bacterium]MBT4147461.1 hypothetical protein [Gammaproteobacteria bacterium]MBT5222084.1 hypothetical protein [Gammaproteobacteria bacterium]MBT5825639.1 hypothetical protein [Gammaproteobacteria bacterium]